MLRSANFAIYAVQYLDENQEEWQIGETEDGTLLVSIDENEAREVMKAAQEAAPEVRWRVTKYCASGYSEEMSTYGRVEQD
jgi:hypothetical protein